MVAHATTTTIYIYIIVIEVSYHLPKLKRGMASFFFQQISMSGLISL